MSTLKAENETKTTTTKDSLPAIPSSIMKATFPDSEGYQLPVNMSTNNHASSNAIVAVTQANVTTTFISTRHNVSVTNIKCEMVEVQANPDNSNLVSVMATNDMAQYDDGTRLSGVVGYPCLPIPSADNSDSENELANIENLKVNRCITSTNGRVSVLGLDIEGSMHTKNGPRPMSWEGELSENEPNEVDLMDTELSLSNGALNDIEVVNVPVIKSEIITATATASTACENLALYSQHYEATSAFSPITHTHTQTKHSIKSEVEQISADMHNAVIYSSPQTKLKLCPAQSDPINLKYEPPDLSCGGVNSPLLARSKITNLPLPANPSPDSAIHSVYTHSSPSQSPLTSRHAPYTPSLSRNNSDASHSSCYSYSSDFSPTNSPIQARHAPPATASGAYGNYNGSVQHGVLYRPLAMDGTANSALEVQNLSIEAKAASVLSNSNPDNGIPSASAGISRQQLINSPCPICGDKISGFHYGIFSCESCKGFFKRTVQNRKNYVCVRGGPCLVSISTRKKCPACRFDKCLQKGMKLEAIREDRTRGGRSTYQCSYTLPQTILNPLLSPEQVLSEPQPQTTQQQRFGIPSMPTNNLSTENLSGFGPFNNVTTLHARSSSIKTEQPTHNLKPINGSMQQNMRTLPPTVPTLLQEIMDVEHLWQYNEAELARINQPMPNAICTNSSLSSISVTSSNEMTNTLLVSCGLSSNSENANPDWIAHLCNVADHRLYKIVKWCKSLPLFKHISIDDQIRLLINSWCELLLFSCCFRSMYTPGEIKLSQGKTISLAQAKSSGLQACIERMLNLTDHLRRLRVDRYEYVAMKVIVLLQSDTSELQEPVKVRECQEKALQSLQAYTNSHYPDTPAKFGELLLRIPDLQRTYQLGKEMLTIKSRDGDTDFNLLMELLRGEH